MTDAAMDSDAASSLPQFQRNGRSDLIRFLSWSMFAVLIAYLINNYLVLGQKWSSLRGLAQLDWQAVVQLVVYLGALVLAFILVKATASRSLRADADRISAINAYLIRSMFWAVLLIGLVDMTVSFLRVEGLLTLFVDEQLAKDLARPLYRGPVVHIPLLIAGLVLGAITRTLGFHWLALLIVIAELLIVITRFIFSYEQAFMGDLVRFWYAALFLFASAYTLLEDGHVRVDVLYAGMSRTAKGYVNAFGAIAMGMTLCWTIIIIGLGGKSAVIYGPLANFEVSQSGFGMYTKYWMAGFLGVFAITMLLQFIAQFLEACADLRNDPGGREVQAPVAH